MPPDSVNRAKARMTDQQLRASRVAELEAQLKEALERIAELEAEARDIFRLAGELAAARERKKSGTAIPQVRITLSDMWQALNLLAPTKGWNGSTTPALDGRLEGIEGPITAEKLRKALR